ncbi:hypothetical protein TNCV_73851 [Trichonephila clavipes]|nr:hypothetical protein TNCV_73851 [Trichonephila clavipes]
MSFYNSTSGFPSRLRDSQKRHAGSMCHNSISINSIPHNFNEMATGNFVHMDSLESTVEGRRTVRGRLLEIGLCGCKAHPKPLLTEFQRKRRLTWAREHSLWTIKDWEKCLKPTVKYPTKVMVWGCMSSHGVGRLPIVSGRVKAMEYIEILQNKFLPTARDLLGNQS